MVTVQVDGYNTLMTKPLQKKIIKSYFTSYIFLFFLSILHFFFLFPKCSFLSQHISPVDFGFFLSFLPLLDSLNNGN